MHLVIHPGRGAVIPHDRRDVRPAAPLRRVPAPARGRDVAVRAAVVEGTNEGGGAEEEFHEMCEK